ncbi:hypothetical protein CSUI_007311 [Cystoisospora suis]|uniref:Uncharacterized protein n=1 Tax=Cystoisospora suis TaxID=483139 RepID=A0A2C6KP09_9APIC|nr:hypothetical protein CSUI_007311 [Cystoisospora suis]
MATRSESLSESQGYISYPQFSPRPPSLSPSPSLPHSSPSWLRPATAPPAGAWLFEDTGKAVLTRSRSRVFQFGCPLLSYPLAYLQCLAGEEVPSYLPLRGTASEPRRDDPCCAFCPGCGAHTPPKTTALRAGDRLVIQGPPQSGKTFLLKHLAAEALLRDRRGRILLLSYGGDCSHSSLREALRNLLEGCALQLQVARPSSPHHLKSASEYPKKKKRKKDVHLIADALKRTYLITVFTPLQLLHVVKWLPAFLSSHPSVRTVFVDGVITHWPGAGSAGYTPFVLCDDEVGTGNVVEKARGEIGAPSGGDHPEQMDGHHVAPGSLSPKETAFSVEAENSRNFESAQRQSDLLASTTSEVAAAQSSSPGALQPCRLSSPSLSTESADPCRLPLSSRVPPPPSAAQLLTAAVQELFHLHHREKFLLLYTKQFAGFSSNSTKTSGLASIELCFPICVPVSSRGTVEGDCLGDHRVLPSVSEGGCSRCLLKKRKRENSVPRLQERLRCYVRGAREEGGATSDGKSNSKQGARSPEENLSWRRGPLMVAGDAWGSTSNRHSFGKVNDSRFRMIARFEGLPHAAAAALRLACNKRGLGVAGGPRGKGEELPDDRVSPGLLHSSSEASRGNIAFRESSPYSYSHLDHKPSPSRQFFDEAPGRLSTQVRRFSESRVFRLQLIPAIEAFTMEGYMGETESGSQAASGENALLAWSSRPDGELRGGRRSEIGSNGSRIIPFSGSVIACICTYASREEIGRSNAVAGAAVWKGEKEGDGGNTNHLISGAVGGCHVVLCSGEGPISTADQRACARSGHGETQEPALRSKSGIFCCSRTESLKRSGSGEGREEGVMDDREECGPGDGGGGHPKTLRHYVANKCTLGVKSDLMCCGCCMLFKRGGTDAVLPL